jgi:type IV secretion system protein VirB10
MIKLNTLILPNGYMVNLNAIPSNTDSGGGETVNEEGKIKGDTSKASDVDTVIQTTSIGAGIGGIAARSGKGAGIVSGVGAAAGIMGVLLSRGPEAELPRGTTLDVILNRPIYLDADKVQFTSAGQASTLAGPSDRQKRTKIPF